MQWMMLFALVMLGCVNQPTGFVIGLDEPPGVFTQPGQILSIAPSQLIFDTTTDQKVITVLVKDPFVYKEVYLCSAPCKDIRHWTKLGDLQGISLSGNYLNGAAGLRQDFSLLRSKLNSGNNFIAVFTCKGVGLCNNMKWVKQKFRVDFTRCVNDDECTGNKKKCDTATGSCVECLAPTHCTDPTKPYCQQTTSMCVGCLQDAHCSNNEKCNPSTNTCVQCYNQAHCAPGQQCVNEKCIVKAVGKCTLTPSYLDIRLGSGSKPFTVTCLAADDTPTSCPLMELDVYPQRSYLPVTGTVIPTAVSARTSSTVSVTYTAPSSGNFGGAMLRARLHIPSGIITCEAVIVVTRPY